MQGEQDVGGELGDAFGELEQLFLGRDLPDRRQQRPAHSQPDQLRLLSSQRTAAAAPPARPALTVPVE